MSLDIEAQYDRIYRYCYFKLHSREMAEDVTQETFLRYLQHYRCMTTASALQCLYTIARNLCVDEYRKRKAEYRDAPVADDAMEDRLLANLAARMALSRLTTEEQELLLLRYANEVPVSALSKFYGVSRFAVYRRMTAAVKRFREELRKEGYDA